MIVMFKKRSMVFLFSGIFLVGLSVGTVKAVIHPHMKVWQDERIVISKIDTKQKAVALTFDDGPDPAATPVVLDTLQKYGAKATFFVLGFKVELYPEVAKKIISNGNEIGGHSWAHDDYNKHNKDYMHDDIAKTNQVIYKTCGVNPTWFRPPGGFLSNDLIDLMYQDNQVIAYWTYQTDSKDWRNGVNAASIASHIINHIAPGQIIILHDGCPNSLQTAQALSILIPKLQAQGYSFVTMSELVKLASKE